MISRSNSLKASFSRKGIQRGLDFAHCFIRTYNRFFAHVIIGDKACLWSYMKFRVLATPSLTIIDSCQKVLLEIEELAGTNLIRIVAWEMQKTFSLMHRARWN